jgi:hypothetical protein
MMSIATGQYVIREFNHLADRFEGSQSKSELLTTEADAGMLLRSAVDAKLLDLVLPAVQPPQKMSDDRSSQWAGVWTLGVSQLSMRWLDFPVSNPLQITSKYVGGPDQLTVGGDAAADWRIQAKKYASVCRALAAAMQPESSDLIELDEIVMLAGVGKKATQNAVSDWRKAGHQIDYPCSYRTIRSLLLERWPNRLAVLSENFADVRSYLDQHR